MKFLNNRPPYRVLMMLAFDVDRFRQADNQILAAIPDGRCSVHLNMVLLGEDLSADDLKIFTRYVFQIDLFHKWSTLLTLY